MTNVQFATVIAMTAAILLASVLAEVRMNRIEGGLAAHEVRLQLLEGHK